MKTPHQTTKQLTDQTTKQLSNGISLLRSGGTLYSSFINFDDATVIYNIRLFATHDISYHDIECKTEIAIHGILWLNMFYTENASRIIVFKYSGSLGFTIRTGNFGVIFSLEKMSIVMITTYRRVKYCSIFFGAQIWCTLIPQRLAPSDSNVLSVQCQRALSHFAQLILKWCLSIPFKRTYYKHKCNANIPENYKYFRLFESKEQLHCSRRRDFLQLRLIISHISTYVC